MKKLLFGFSSNSSTRITKNKTYIGNTTWLNFEGDVSVYKEQDNIITISVSGGGGGGGNISGSISENQVAFGTGANIISGDNTFLFDNATKKLIVPNIKIGNLTGLYKFENGELVGGVSTSDIPEGSNLYWTEQKFNSSFSNKTTDDLNEGVNNLYFKADRARDVINANQPILYNKTTGYISLDTPLNVQYGGTGLSSLGSAGQILRVKLDGSGLEYFTPNYLTTETDPVFSASPAAGITSTNISNWNTAYNHSQTPHNYESPLTFSSPLSRSVNTISLLTQMSIEYDTNGLKLKNDTANPGASKYYGTDSGGNKGWFTLPSGGGASTFLQLTDTPTSYSGESGRYIRVNLNETGLEFFTPDFGLVGTKEVDESNAVNGAILSFNASNNKLRYIYPEYNQGNNFNSGLLYFNDGSGTLEYSPYLFYNPNQNTLNFNGQLLLNGPVINQAWATGVNAFLGVDSGGTVTIVSLPIGITNGGTGMTTIGTRNQFLKVDNNGDGLVYESFEDLMRRMFVFWTDFLGPAGAATLEAHLPLDLVLISSGTQAKIAGEPNHPGILRISSSTTANSGGYILTDTTAFRIAGGEAFEIVFQHRVANGTNTTIRFGFLDTTTSADAVDGVYFEIPAGSLAIRGKTANNSTRSTTTSSYTLAINTWYRARIVINEDASEARFSLFNDNRELLFEDSLTTNIPTATGRETGCGVIATNSGTTATLLIYIDYMAMWYNRQLNR